MKSKKAKEKAIQEQLDRILEILNGYEYNGPLEKMGAVTACTDIGEKIIYGDGSGEQNEAKD